MHQVLSAIFAQIYQDDVLVIRILEELGISDLLSITLVSKRFNHLILTSSSLQLRLQSQLQSSNITSSSCAASTSKQALDRLISREKAFNSLTPRITAHDSLHPPDIANWREGLLYKAWYKHSVPGHLGNSYMRFWKRKQGQDQNDTWDSWTVVLDDEVDGLTIWPNEGLLVVAKYLEPVEGCVPVRFYFLDCDVSAHPPNTTFSLELSRARHPRAQKPWVDLILPDDFEPIDYVCFVPCSMNRLAVGVSSRLVLVWDWVTGLPVVKMPGEIILDSTWTSFLDPFHLAFLADTCRHLIDEGGPHAPISVMEIFRLPTFSLTPHTPDGTSFAYDDIPNVAADMILVLPEAHHAPTTAIRWNTDSNPEEANERRLVVSDGLMVFSAEVGRVEPRSSRLDGETVLMMLSGAVSIDHILNVVDTHLKIPVIMRRPIRYDQWHQGKVALWTHAAPSTWDRNIAAYGSRFVSLSFSDTEERKDEIQIRLTIRDFHQLTAKYGERRLGQRLGGDLSRDVEVQIQNTQIAVSRQITLISYIEYRGSELISGLRQMDAMSLSDKQVMTRKQKPSYRMVERDLKLKQASQSRDCLLIVVFDGDSMIIWADGVKVTTLDFVP
ncbi:hypothetical protein BCR39DRAFT_542059 [Naematelia encephala]|uniref:F-box domain-containing protein n=1 Tax=Naematelia encephala TaxID=71784 RepID=A0A1Y2AUN5_9TREE|nr:hypothetical protein BCR39DRAFT_542059 [Naematelia encephala]